MRNPYYHTCPYCGANLDPGERCECGDDQVTPSNETEEAA